jgi:two-component system cell cycle sensor histidine kinase/response regulator CckA
MREKRNFLSGQVPHIRYLTDSEVPRERDGKGPLVLLVDDEQAVLFITSRILRRRGYMTLIAKGPEEAEILFGRRASEIDLVVSDVYMPNTNGVHLIRKLWAIRSDVKVLLMSGYDRQFLNATMNLDGMEYIQKPFTSNAFAAKVGEMLAVNPS